MGFLKIFTLSILSLVLTLVISFAITSFSIQALFYPDLYKKVLEENNVYDLIGEQLRQNNLDKVISEDVVMSEINKMLGNGLAYMRSDVDELDLKVQLDPTLPEIDLADYDKGGNINTIRSFVTAFNSTTQASLVLIFLIPVLILLISKDSLKIFSKRIGMTLATIGILNIIFGYLGKIGISELVPRLIPIESTISLAPIITGITYPIFDNLILYSGIVLAIGVVLIAFSFLKKEKKK